MKITFLDGSQKEFNEGMSAYEIAQSISPSLAKKSIYALVNDEKYDITRPIKHDATLELKFKEDSFDIHQQANDCTYHGLNNIIDAIAKTRARLNANVNFELTIMLLINAIKENTR